MVGVRLVLLEVEEMVVLQEGEEGMWGHPVLHHLHRQDLRPKWLVPTFAPGAKAVWIVIWIISVPSIVVITTRGICAVVGVFFVADFAFAFFLFVTIARARGWPDRRFGLFREFRFARSSPCAVPLPPSPEPEPVPSGEGGVVGSEV